MMHLAATKDSIVLPSQGRSKVCVYTILSRPCVITLGPIWRWQSQQDFFHTQGSNPRPLIKGETFPPVHHKPCWWDHPWNECFSLEPGSLLPYFVLLRTEKSQGRYTESETLVDNGLALLSFFTYIPGFHLQHGSNSRHALNSLITCCALISIPKP